jgi:tRNA1Val (adenine37-N6)-methyltransferase
LLVHDVLHTKGLPIVQSDDSFRYSLDSLLLAYFTPLTPSVKTIVDLCSGNVPIPLYMSLRTSASIDAVDHHKSAFHNATKSIAMNHKEHQITPHLLDVKTCYLSLGHDKYDLVTCNPPYFSTEKPSVVSKSVTQASARHETTLTLEDVLVAAKRLLKNKGTLSLIHRVERLDDLFAACTKHHLMVKTLRFVHSFHDHPANVVLVTIKKGAQRGGLQILSPVITFSKPNEYSPQIQAVYAAQFMV